MHVCAFTVTLLLLQRQVVCIPCSPADSQSDKHQPLPVSYGKSINSVEFLVSCWEVYTEMRSEDRL